MTPLGLHFADWLTLVFYLLIVMAVGLWANRRIKTAGDYFMGGRKFNKWMLATYSFGAGTHADQAVGVISKTYQVGLAGIWYQWLWLFCTPFYWVLAPLFRRLRVMTTADFYERRYNRSVSTLYSLWAMFGIMVSIGIMLLSCGKVVESLTGGKIPFGMAVFGTTAMFLMYGLGGGLWAAVITELVQGALTVVFSFLLLPFALEKVGGFQGLHQALPEKWFSLTTPGEITLFFIGMSMVNALFDIVAQPHIMSGAASGPTEFDGRFGLTVGNFLKRICTIAWAFTGLCCVALYPNLADPDHAFGRAVSDLLPAGLVGLLLASMIATVQDTCDALMITAAGLYTRNIHRTFIHPEASEKEQIRVGRIAALTVVAGGLAFTFALGDVASALELGWKMGPFMGISFWLGILWRRANPASAWASFLCAGAMFALCETGVVAVSLPWQMLLDLTAGILGGVAAGYVFPRMEKKKLDDFYLTLHTKVGDEHKLKAAGVDIIME